MTTSPVSPWASSSDEVSLMIATSGPAAQPTVPGLRLPGGSWLQVIWCDASVIA